MVEEHVLESRVVGGVLAGTDVEGDQQDSGRALQGRAPSPHSTSLFTSHCFGFLSKIDCRTIGLREVKWEYNDLGKNSHFWERFVFVFNVYFGVEKSTAKGKLPQFSPTVIMLSL